MKDTTASGVRILINGETTTVAEGATLATVLEDHGAPPRGVAVAVDGAVVPRAAWESTVLSADTEVEIVIAVQGG